ncbi:MAG: phosphodiester glycosidase family protein [Tepidisphaeraceae bacterium]
MLRRACFALAIALPTLVQAVTHDIAQPFVGVTHHRFVQKAGEAPTGAFVRPVVVDVLEIDLKADGVRFLMQPSNGDRPGEITRIRTTSFLDSVKAQMGVNVGFYDTKAPYGGFDTDLMHLAVSEGNVYSAAHGGEAVFNISKDNVAEIATAGAKDSVDLTNGHKVYNAAGGNQRILTDGKVSAPPDANYTRALNPHTALGVSKDHRRVFLATVDGRQKGYAEGMRTNEFAEVLLSLGAWDAVNLDGGGSTTMAMDDTDDGVANAHVINSPSDGSTSSAPGKERVVANSLAVFAKPNKDYRPLPPVARPKPENLRPLVITRTVLDDFESGVGHFASAPTASGTTKNLSEASKATLDTAQAHDGHASLRLDLANADAQQGMQLRLLSGEGKPEKNLVDGKTLGNNGYLGFWLRATPAKGTLFVSVLIDDIAPDNAGTERGQLREVIADGQWHLYQWNVDEDGRWTAFNNGNGVIDGGNATLDSIYFTTSKDGTAGAFEGSVWVDSVTYDPTGHLDAKP